MTAEGKGNALHRLRTRLGYSVHDAAQRMGVSVADVDALEQTPLRLLELDALDRYVSAIECRLDVVAVHVDGEAIWLSEETP